ncbi:MAG TPA: dihydrodipicolinate reductase C-terminal domain-containing protein [Ignavibacteriaceae bacterium]|nr:dihydrodipicolinate reductase C-terminal domain-containing protein [Ignavibacteriaceae bacterium]
MNNIKYGLIGASGKMGKEISSIMNENGNVLVFNYDIDGEVFTEKPEVLIDFSLPAALEKTIEYVKKFKSPLIIGTTGFNDEHLKKLHELSEIIPIVQSYNFSVGVQMLIKCAELINTKLKDWDIEITETHHRFKKDKPSGTAIMIKNALGKEINISSLRVGNVVGEHSITFGGLGETLTVTHSALSRRTFAEGVLRAVQFILNKKNGFYSIKDVLA